jgi:hypothetical protein
MNWFFLAFIVLFIRGYLGEELKYEDLPECPYHDPIKQADEWRQYHKTTACKITVVKPDEETEEDKRYKYGGEQYSFNVYVR